MLARSYPAWIVCVALTWQPAFCAEPAPPSFDTDVLPLLRARCVKCHGPAKREGELDLSQAHGVAAGGENGLAVDRISPLTSRLWQRIEADEMPPDEPLSDAERQILRRWLAAGANGVPLIAADSGQSDHWAFRRLARPPARAENRTYQAATAIDGFLLAELATNGLSYSPAADRYTLIRRLSFDLTGLPPTIEEIEAFVNDAQPDAYERLVERYLASPHYGERWGKWWLDAAGYADSNGYFNADSDRPLAYRYRDYVVASFNADKPFDQFLREQLAGDELAGYRPGGEIRPEQVELLVATHFLRNAQDGTGESDGNPDEVRADRYSVLEGTEQMIGSALLGLTLQCARCHDHKFEPVTQTDYYSLQAILAAAFDPEHWLKPNEREVNTATPAQVAAWEAREHEIDREIATQREAFAGWLRQNRPRGRVLFEDHFDAPDELTRHWSNSAPGDDGPGGTPAVQIASTQAPAAKPESGTLAIVESGAAGNRWLSTAAAFDWAPADRGATIQVTFDLVADQWSGSPPAARIGYYIGLHDYNDSSQRAGGNLLIDGNPAGGADVHVDYPGADARSVGHIGSTGCRPGHNYGVRITNAGDGRYKLEQLVDGVAEEPAVMLDGGDLTPGGFGFEFCCGRSFVVDNVVIESAPAGDPSEKATEFREAQHQRRQALDSAVAELNRRRTEKPGRTAVVLDITPTSPDWFLLVRGNYGQRGQPVAAGIPAVLSETTNPYVAATVGASSGRRLAFARWLTEPGTRAASLLARVTVNRIWQQHFGAGICSTPDNLGYSGSPPSHPELLDYLASELVEGGWSVKRLHRAIMLSAAYRQASLPRDDGLRIDPGNRLLWRFGLRRLDAESVRDAALAIAGQLERSMGGPYVPTQRRGDGEVVVDENQPAGKRRSLYLQQRRTQTLSLLEVFDAPSIVVNCTRRNQATIPLQSLSALNSEFAVNRAHEFAMRLAEAPAGELIRRAFLLVAGRPPRDDELAAAESFLASQPSAYAGRPDAARLALVDFCQALLAGNAFLYVE
ncbi:MAG TPA: PSD1 and planctomycete cytochrome C domain-containing protein [Pirellulales bacterium]|nr:PSD1 and planctomycete cytochrome C domain-containing protein [Pirellulales bacterium]